MLKSSEKTGTNEFTFAFSISAEEFESSLNRAYHMEKKNVEVPGFRKGKAPRAIIEKRYGEKFFYEKAFEIIFPVAYDNAIEETGAEPVDKPNDIDIQSIGKDGIEFTCKVTVKPEITIEGYKGLSAVRFSTEVTEKDVEADLQKKLETNARIIDAEDKAVENGNIAVIDFEGFIDGKPFKGGKMEAFELEIGSGAFVADFEEQLIGHTAGEEFDVKISFPDDYNASVAGKTALFKVKLRAVKIKELPAADDEFAKDISEFDTLDELKADIRETLKAENERASDAAFEEAIFNKLISLSDVEIPEVMTDTKVKHMMYESKFGVESQGLDFEQYLRYLNVSAESLQENYAEKAKKDIKRELILEKIAEKENIEVSDEEIEEMYATMAREYETDVESIKGRFHTETVKQEILNKKAGELIIKNAVAEEAPKTEKTVAEKPAEEKPAEEKAEKKTSQE